MQLLINQIIVLVNLRCIYMLLQMKAQKKVFHMNLWNGRMKMDNV